MLSNLPPRNKALLALLLANAGWGLSFPLGKALMLIHQSIDPTASSWFSTFLVVGPRFWIASIFLLGWLALRGELTQVTKGEFRLGMLLGFFSSAGMLFQSEGLQHTAASTSAFLTQMYAVLIPLFTALWLRRFPTLKLWLCAALVFFGVAILGRFEVSSFSFGYGETLTLISSLFFMGQILSLDSRVYPGANPLRSSAVMFSVQGLVFLVCALLFAPSLEALATPIASKGWLILTGALTLFSTLMAFLLMNRWQKEISPTEAGLLYCIEPIFGSVFALFLPAWFSLFGAIAYQNEELTSPLLIGGFLITAANVLIHLKPKGASLISDGSR